MEQSLDPALFNMLPKKMRHTQPAKFQPMANKHSVPQGMENQFDQSAANIPVRVANLDLSKAFHCAHWPAVWKSLFEQNISYI